MEVDDNEDTFVDDSDDTDEESQQEQQQTKTKTKTKTKTETKQSEKDMSAITTRYAGKSNTIRLSPIPRGFTEAHIYTFIKSNTNIAPTSITISLPKNYPTNRIAKDKSHSLYDARNAYIIFDSNDNALSAATQVDKQLIPNTEFACQCTVTSQSKNNCTNYKDKSNWIKITNLSKDVNEQAVLTHVQNVSGIKNKPKNIYLFHHEKEHYRGFAFIECANTSDANACVRNLNMSQLGADNDEIWCTWRPIRRELDRKVELKNKTKQLLLGNLHYALQPNDISQLLSAYGQVQHVQIWYDKSGYPCGNCSVTMESFEQAVKVFDELNGKKMKNLKIITAFTKITNVKKNKIINKLNKQKKSLKKEIIQNKNIQKKIKSENKELRSNAKRARGGKRFSGGRRDGVGGNNRRMKGGRGRGGRGGSRGGYRGRGRGGRGRSRGRGRGRNKGPKFA